MMYSCKESESLTPGISQNNDNDSPIKLTSNWGIHRVWNKNAQDCTPPAVNCYDDIIVRPKVMQDLVAVCAGGAPAVGTYFNGNDWMEPFPDLGLPENEDCLTNLQSGNYYMVQVINANTLVSYFEVRLNNSNPDNDPSYVFPVTEQ